MFSKIKSFLPQTLFARSLLILVIPILLIQIITTYVFFERHWSRMSARLAFALAGEISIFADVLESTTSPETQNRLKNYAKNGLELRISVEEGEIDQKTQVFYFGWQGIVSNTLSQALETQVKRPFLVHINAENKKVMIHVALNNGQILSVKTPLRRLFSSSSYIFLLWMIGVSFTLLMIAVLFMRGQIRPIRRLAIAAERFGKGRDMSDFKVQGAKEVRQAGQAFLDMRDRIKRQIEQRTAMLAGVSHDLRTPLTRLKLSLAMVDPDKIPDSKNMIEDLEDMERMIQSYLEFARNQTEEEVETHDIVMMIKKMADKMQENGFSIHHDMPESLEIPIRILAFERCFTNLTKNAKAYAQNLWITVSNNEKDGIHITFEDDGPGIPDDQIQEVFKPFYRVEKSRNNKTGGIGLGLSIAKDVVSAHGGEISLRKSGKGGLSVEIILPL